MNYQLMVDIETLGKKPGCAISSIAAVVFTFDGKIHDQYHCRIDMVSCQDYGLSICADTLKWWLSQSEEARGELNGDTSILDALKSFSDFIHKYPLYEFWANGKEFDFPLLEFAYQACFEVVPWSFRQLRDVRTLLSLNSSAKLSVTKPSIAHNSLDDAMYQSKCCIAVYQSLNISQCQNNELGSR